MVEQQGASIGEPPYFWCIMIIDEKEVLSAVQKAKKILLLEPPYPRKYMPAGLAKLAMYAKAHGKHPTFGRYSVTTKNDLVLVTSLFTYESAIVTKAIAEARILNPDARIIAGGIYASLMPNHFQATTGADIYTGYSKILDQIVPDYAIDWQVDDPWDKFAFTFTSRGCPNSCPYCAVKKIERELWINPHWKNMIVDDKPGIVLCDNNLSSTPDEHWDAVMDFLVKKKKAVVIDSGLDCKHITMQKAKQLAKVCWAGGWAGTRRGLRLAFDRIEEHDVFCSAMEKLVKAGVNANRDSMIFVLFNFKDTPREADYRMRTVANFHSRPYPQEYRPLDWTDKDQSYVGKYWTKRLVKAFHTFWLVPSRSTNDLTFEQWVKSNEDKPDVIDKLTDEDWAAWNNDSGSEPKTWKATKRPVRKEVRSTEGFKL